jgi:hypothetical protein
MPLSPEEQTQIETRIAEIDTILSTGASTVTLDGTTTSYNLSELRRERTALVDRLKYGGTKVRRPMIYRPRLG